MKTRPIILAVMMAIFLLASTACAKSNTDPLNGTKWTLTGYDGSTPVAGTTINMALEDGKVTGSSGCNSYGGSYEINGTKISIRDVASTLMACTDPAGVMDQEGLFLNALNNAQTFQVSGGQLQITTSDGKTLIFSQ